MKIHESDHASRARVADLQSGRHRPDYPSQPIVPLLLWLSGLAVAQPPTHVRIATEIVPKDQRDRPGTPAVDVKRQELVSLVTVADHEWTGTLPVAGLSIAIKLTAKEAAATATFAVDRNADGEFDSSEVRAVQVQTGARPLGGGTPRRQLQLPPIENIAGHAVSLQVRRYEDGTWKVECVREIDYRQGTARMNGRDHVCLVIDHDGDASFGSPGDMFTFLPAETFTKVPGFGAWRGPTYFADEPGIVDDSVVRLLGCDRGGDVRLEISPRGARLAELLRARRTRASTFVAREYPVSFAEFAREHELTARTDPDAGIPWSWHLDAKAALKLARAEGKPLFLLFENDADERCAEMDTYVWHRDDVAAAAKSFACARVSIDLDLEGTFRDFDVRLGPAYVFCTAEGEPLRYVDRRTGSTVRMTKGRKSPAEMVELLTASMHRISARALDPEKGKR